MNNFLNQDPHAVKVLTSRKAEFLALCLFYLNSFGWTVLSQSEGQIKAVDALRRSYQIFVIFHPHENFPTHKDLKKYNQENIMLMAPEFSPICQLKGTKIKKITKHTASGINFTYLNNNGQ